MRIVQTTEQTIDWLADGWFAQCHAPNLSEEFKTWWISYYGTPDSYDEREEEQHEYWIRCAFAWIGWREHSNSQ